VIDKTNHFLIHDGIGGWKMSNTKSEFVQVATKCELILDEIEKAIVGKRRLLETILAAAISEGHILLEDFPGLGKTLMAKSLADVLGLKFKRIQFTTDLLPSDITGGYIYDRSKSNFILRKGPLFANIILADEINRASPKTQSALLEAMQERQVTLEGETMPLPEPFIVVGTQNPIEYEGTFPLPESQLDRFMVKVKVGYPSKSEELDILERRRERKTDEIKLKRVISAEDFSFIRRAVENVYVAKEIEQYIIDLVKETRKDEQVSVGASPRGSLALLKMARAKAAIEGREFVLPDDVKSLATPALVHRLILKPDYWLKQDAAYEVIYKILGEVPVPVLEDV
jgi:MoxR-like ATPase